MTNRSVNGNTIDGTLSYTTRLRMKFQGFKIRMMIALVFGSITVIGLFIYKPPKPVQIPELGPSAQLGLYDLVTWELANKKIAFFKFPPLNFNASQQEIFSP